MKINPICLQRLHRTDSLVTSRLSSASIREGVQKKRFFWRFLPNVCVWFPNKVQTHKKKSPWKSPFLTWISPVVLPNLTKTLGWVNKIGLHLIYQQDFKFWGFRILNHENLKTANFSGFQDSKSSIVKILKNKLLFSSWNSRFWRKGNPFSSLLNEIFSRAKILREKNQFFLSILPSIFLPKLVRNHILLFGWILTSSILQTGKVF